jgi:hypothetical protein
LVDFKEEG